MTSFRNLTKLIRNTVDWCELLPVALSTVMLVQFDRFVKNEYYISHKSHLYFCFIFFKALFNKRHF